MDNGKAGGVKLPDEWFKWSCVERIGTGSYGAVYRAVSTDGRQSAIKVISRSGRGSSFAEMMASDETMVAAGRMWVNSQVREIEALIRLSGNANIVEIQDYKVVEDTENIRWTIYIRMEFLKGLTDYCEGREYSADGDELSDRLITEKKIVQIGRDVCAALSCCEQANILHCDIKPKNLFISENGQVKLGDFGSAKLRSPDKQMSTVYGTELYMAPEMSDRHHADRRTDIYAVGLVLYWLLNNRCIPFVDDPKDMMTAAAQRAVFLRNNGRRVPGPKHGSAQLKKAVLKALDVNPDRRYQTAAEFDAALFKAANLQNVPQQQKKIVAEITAGIVLGGILVVGVSRTASVGKSGEGEAMSAQSYENDSGPSESFMAKLVQKALENGANGAQTPVNGESESAAVSSVSAGSAAAGPISESVSHENLSTSTAPYTESQTSPTEIWIEPETESEAGPEAQSEAESGADIKADSELEPESEQEQENGAESGTDARNGTDPESGDESQADYEAGSQAVRSENGENRESAAYDDSTAESPDQFEYEAILGVVKITSYLGDKESMEIPGRIDGLDVTEIVSLGDSSGLTSVVLPNTIEMVDEDAFSGCSMLKTIEFADGTEVVSSGVLRNQRNIEKVILPASVAGIGREAFAGCISLAAIELPDQISYIGEGAFRDCSSLKEFTLPSKLQTMYKKVFEGSGIESLTLPKSLSRIKNDDDSMDTCFTGCDTLRRIDIEEGTAVLCDYEFYGLTSLETISIPESIERGGNAVFTGCTNLRKVYFGGSAEEWEEMLGRFDSGSWQVLNSAECEFAG